LHLVEVESGNILDPREHRESRGYTLREPIVFILFYFINFCARV